ncbi:hypothetical protein [Nocardioides guangzhouensis]|uniref:hypothetical protein n=1 Tax=Nocardioides guangzhouensis TaxID=2497878 RepID=UPI001438345D|nr:hypothetical protein [Nocardioides guangzhouensis]
MGSFSRRAGLVWTRLRRARDRARQRRVDLYERRRQDREERREAGIRDFPRGGA